MVFFAGGYLSLTPIFHPKDSLSPQAVQSPPLSLTSEFSQYIHSSVLFLLPFSLLLPPPPHVHQQPIAPSNIFCLRSVTLHTHVHYNSHSFNPKKQTQKTQVPDWLAHRTF